MTSKYHQKALEWKSDGLDWEAILNKFIQEGIPVEDAELAIQMVKKEKRAKNRSIGMTLLLLGSVFCAFSMAYTYFAGPSIFMLYGLTIIGVGIAFVGLVYVMG